MTPIGGQKRIDISRFPNMQVLGIVSPVGEFLHHRRYIKSNQISTSRFNEQGNTKQITPPHGFQKGRKERENTHDTSMGRVLNSE